MYLFICFRTFFLLMALSVFSISSYGQSTCSSLFNIPTTTAITELSPISLQIIPHAIKVFGRQIISIKNTFKGPNEIKLRNLSLSSSELQRIIPILKEKKITRIDLSGNRDLSHEVIKELLNEVETIQYLDLHQVPTQTSDILRLLINKHPNIERLRIDNITNHGVKLLLKLPSLKQLHIMNSPRRLNSLGNSASIESLIHLIENLPKLNKITFPNIKSTPKKRNAKTWQDLFDALERKQTIRYYFFRSSFALRPGDLNIKDGDTVEVIPPEKTPEDKTSYRIGGVDTPEKDITDTRRLQLKEYVKKNNPNLNEKEVLNRVDQLAQYERDGGKAATLFAMHLFKSAQRLRITHVKPGKFGGRVIAKVYLEINGQWFSLSTLLIANNLAVKYNGDKKAVHDWSQVLDMDFVKQVINNWSHYLEKK